MEAKVRVALREFKRVSSVGEVTEDNEEEEEANKYYS